jgi:hypothetical protein
VAQGYSKNLPPPIIRRLDPHASHGSAHPARVRKFHSGIILRSVIEAVIEAPLITREVLPETHFLSVIMAADAQAGPFLQFQASLLMWNLVNF